MNTLRRYFFIHSATSVDSQGHGVRPPNAWAITQKLTVGLLVATMAITAVLPTIAGAVPHKRHGNQPHQEQGPSAEARGKGNKDGKAKSVKKTFSNGGVIAVPGDTNQTSGIARPYPSPIAVTGFKKAKITDVNLTLRGFGHEAPADVDVLLVAPGGRNAVVMSDVGSNAVGDSDVVDLTLRLDDEAASPLPLDELLSSGSFQPNDDTDSRAFPAPAPDASANTTLSTFDGIDPNGQWQLFIVDNGNGDTGAITEGWSLEITAKAKNKKKR